MLPWYSQSNLASSLSAIHPRPLFLSFWIMMVMLEVAGDIFKVLDGDIPLVKLSIIFLAML